MFDERAKHNDQEVFCCGYFDFSLRENFIFNNMCHRITNHEILQLNDEEMQIMTLDTSPFRALHINLVETNTEDALLSKSNAISLSIIVVYQLIYALSFFPRIGHFRVLPCLCLFCDLVTLTSICLGIVISGLSSSVSTKQFFNTKWTLHPCK